MARGRRSPTRARTAPAPAAERAPPSRRRNARRPSALPRYPAAPPLPGGGASSRASTRTRGSRDPRDRDASDRVRAPSRVTARCALESCARGAKNTTPPERARGETRPRRPETTKTYRPSFSLTWKTVLKLRSSPSTPPLEKKPSKRRGSGSRPRPRLRRRRRLERLAPPLEVPELPVPLPQRPLQPPRDALGRRLPLATRCRNEGHRLRRRRRRHPRVKADVAGYRGEGRRR